MTRLSGIISQRLADAQWLGQLLVWPILSGSAVVLLTIYILFGSIGLVVFLSLIAVIVWLIIMLLFLHLLRGIYLLIKKLIVSLVNSQ